MMKRSKLWMGGVAMAVLLAAQTVLAGFRVAEAPADARSSAMMSAQSLEDGVAETVETTTADAPLTVDFAALGVEDATEAYVMLVNETTGDAVALEATDASEKLLELPPLALAELEMRHLGAAQQYRCVAMRSAKGAGQDEVLASRLVATSLGEVELPNFNYLTEDGDVRMTTLNERQLVGYNKLYPIVCLADPEAEGNAEALAATRAAGAHYMYSYALPDGTEAGYSIESSLQIATGETFTVQTESANFKVTYSSATSAEAKKAFAYALQLWSGVLGGTQPIRVYLDFSPLEPGVLGQTSPNFIKFKGVDVWFPHAVASQLADRDINPSDYAFTMTISSEFPWYFGLDGKPPSGYRDLVSVFLHEACHGLGFCSEIDLDTGKHCLEYPTLYDTYLYADGKRLTAMTASERKAAMTSDALYFDGPSAKEQNSGKRMKIHSPSASDDSYGPGSSGSHWAWDVPFYKTTFMRYAYAYPFHEFTAIKRGAMLDLGWAVAMNVSTKVPAAPTGVNATKGTVSGGVDVSWSAADGAKSYSVYRSKSQSGTYTLVKQGWTSCTWSDPGVTGTNWYKVAASNAAGLGPQSAAVYGYPKATVPSVTNVTISGPATLAYLVGADYTATAWYSDGSTADVTKAATWSFVYGSQYATLSGNHLTAGSLLSSQMVTLQASYRSAAGKTFKPQKNVTIQPSSTVNPCFLAGTNGTASFVRREYTIGQKYGELPTVTVKTPGKMFDGWYTAENGGNKITTETIAVANVLFLWARYVNAPETVTSVRVEAPNTVEWGKTVTAICMVTVNGKEREATETVHWGFNGGVGMPFKANQTRVTVGANSGSTGSLSIVATVSGKTSPEKVIRALAPTVKLTLDPNGGSVSPTTVSVTNGVAIRGLPTPTWTSSWNFQGWYTGKTSGSKVANGTVYDGTYTTLYARWEKVVTLSSVSVVGPTSVVSGAVADYACTARYSDGTTQTNVAATWGASAGTMANGTFTAPGVTNATTVKVWARYTSQGVTKGTTNTVTVMPKTVSVRFDAAGGTADFSTRTYTVGVKYGTLPGASWDRYHGFDGWFTSAGTDGERVTSDTLARETVTRLVAKWSDIVLPERLEITGVSTVSPGEAIVSQLKCAVKYSNGTSKDVTKEATWKIVKNADSVNPNGTAKNVTENTIVTVQAKCLGLEATRNVTIVPQKVKVAFDAQGGTLSGAAQREYVVGLPYNSFPAVSNEGYRPLGWYTAAKNGTRVFPTDTASANVTKLYAQWEANPPTLARIELSANPTTVTAGGTSYVTCTAVYTNAAGTTRDSISGADAAWTVSPAGAGTVGAGVFTAARVTERTVATVVARYQGKTNSVSITVNPETVSVAFEGNGGTVAETARTYVVGASYGSFPVARGATTNVLFDGWFTAKEDGTRVTEEMTCEKTITHLWAHWTETRRLVGVRVEGPTKVTATEAATFTAHARYSDGTEIPAKADSWKVSPTTLGAVSPDGVFTASLVPEETEATIEATVDGLSGSTKVTVAPLTVSVRFDPCDGAVTPERKTYVVGSAYSELPTPVRSRYDFDAWYTGVSKSGSKVEPATLASADVTTLYAGWTPAATTLVGIRIVGPVTVRAGGTTVYSCEALYANGTSGSVVPVWSIAEGRDWASLTLGGFFSANETDVERTVTIQAVYNSGGVRYQDQLEVSITPATLVVDPPAMSLESDAQGAEILVDTRGDWTVETDVPWIALAKVSGTGIDTVGFTVTANPETEERTGTITVKSDGLTAMCVVKQYSPVPEEYLAVTLDPCIPGRESSVRQYVKGRKFGFLPQPIREGYSFAGWWTGKGGTGLRVHALSLVDESTSVLYAHWQEMDVAHALNNALDWVEDAVRPWRFDYVEAQDRKVSMTTPVLLNKESATLTVLVEGPGTIGFWWKTSSEEFFDVLSFKVDGKFAASISGETLWQAMSRAISGYGQHVLTWTYAKDGQGASGQDAAWLDMVSWQPDYAGMGGASIQSADGRAVPEAWLNAYGLDTGGDALDEDADGDGMTNFEEYVSGTDPTDSDSLLEVFMEFDADGKPIVNAIGGPGTILEGKTDLGDSDEPWAPADLSVHRFFRARTGEP